MTMLAGIDIGGTKCAVILGQHDTDEIALLDKRSFPTPTTPEATIAALLAHLGQMLADSGLDAPAAIGISCGGPLDSRAGRILAPPNLPGWDEVDIVRPFQERFGAPTGLQNDANACALAEWRWGAGRGCRNMIFLTFGTGMGAGLILDGRLYAGTNDMAGEVGHVRLAETGPIGYGKAGSFEGFCSGGGIARMAYTRAESQLRAGQPGPRFCPTLDDLPHITAHGVAEAALEHDPLALEIYGIVGHQLGKGLAILVDILNPERIVIGSIYTRQRDLLEPLVLAALRKEAQPRSLAVCQILPAGLGEQVGDFASLSVAASLREGKR